jgi:NTE family protein
LKRIRTLLFLLLLVFPSGSARERPKIGLVLSGGGAKGLAHIPVFKLLDKLDIPVDYVAGTSAGGIMGALYARGYSGADLEKISADIAWRDMFSDRPPRSYLPFFEKKLDGRYQLEFVLRKGIPSVPRGLIFGEKFQLLFSRLIFPFPADADFAELPIPFRCVAVDLVTGQEVILRSGSLPRAMRATMAIPTIFSPVDWDDYLLVDGGVLDNLPVDVVKDMGADIIIAVDLGAPLYPKKELNSADQVLSQTLRIVEADQKKETRELIDILIHPDMKGLGSMDFFFPERLTRIKEQGQIAAEKSRPLLEAIKEKYELSRSREMEKKLWPQGRSAIIRQQGDIILDQVSIMGNQRLPASFISRLFNLKQGDAVDGTKISQQIMQLYSLGYFENISYDVYSAGDNKINVLLNVKELPRGKFKVGLRYDNFHKLVGAAGVYSTNLLLPGLRLENELEAGGLTRFLSKISYPSQTLNFPLYPFFQVGYKSIPTRLYDGEGSLITKFEDRSWTFGAGFGFLLRKRVNVEIAYEQEKINVELDRTLPDPAFLPGLRTSLKRVAATATLDTLDSVWTPSRGLFFRANYEGSYSLLGSDLPYELAEASLDVYETFSQKHSLRFYGYWGDSSKETPFYKWLDQGRPDSFIGMDYDQLLGNQMKILRGEYRYKLNDFVYLKAAGNVAFDFKQRWPAETYSPDLLWGVGAGVQIASPAGPLELIYGVGSKSLSAPKSSQGVVYLVLGIRL